MVKRLIMGREGVVRAVKLKTGNGYFEKAVQHLFPLELSCDVQIAEQLNPEAPEYNSQPRRAANKAVGRIQEMIRLESKEQ